MGVQRNTNKRNRRYEELDRKIAKLLPEYYSGKYSTTSEFLRKFGLVTSTFYSYLHRNGLSSITKDARIYQLNEDYFLNIDSSEKAYWLGFLQCDGYISCDNRYVLELTLTASDKNHIDKFQKALNSNYPVKYRTIAGKYKAVRLDIVSLKLLTPLTSFGIEKFRSCTMEMLLDENNLFILDYLRGIIDANGTIDLSGCNPVIWLSSGSKQFVEQFVSILQKLFSNLHCSVHEKKPTVFSVYVGTAMTEKLLEHCYKDVCSDIVLDRKLEKANAALSKIAQNT